uniref:Uncharacterized protein n=1 Tax=Arundo donax TaxID=35708 RepID=A0A0A9H627_ARUDO
MHLAMVDASGSPLQCSLSNAGFSRIL